MRPIPLVLLAVLGLAPLAGCGDDPKWNAVKKEAGETWDALKAYTRNLAERMAADHPDELDWPNRECDEPGCMALAAAAASVIAEPPADE